MKGRSSVKNSIIISYQSTDLTASKQVVSLFFSKDLPHREKKADKGRAAKTVRETNLVGFDKF